jgi:hypothetical protein
VPGSSLLNLLSSDPKVTECMRLSYQRARDIVLLVVGIFILGFEFIVAPKPDSTIVIAAIGLIGSPAFLNRDEK